jgi:B12-binding domain/radical SAM domain protein
MPDLVLIHPPSIYDFRRKTALLGPISDVIPSSPVFEGYPIGFISILSYLQKHGYSTRILNIALKMLASDRFDPERAIKSLKPLAFGIDLHWLAHAHGALEVAKAVKRWHPNTPVILGGLSATYFHIEIIKNHPEVDYVVRGDTAEEPLLKLINNIESLKEPEDVPNVTWRNSSGKIRVNPLTFVPEDIDEYTLDYGALIKSAAKSLDVEGYLQYRDWFKYPLTALLTSKGCAYNCVTCGGSKYAYANMCARSKIAFKSPERLVEEIKIIEDYVKNSIFILNDIRMGGRKYVQSLLDKVKVEKVDNPLIFELFEPADEKFLGDVIKASPNASLEISPESHSESVRRAFGKAYGNDALERTLAYAQKLGFKRVDVFFMIGLPRQDRESVLKTVEYAEDLLKRYGADGRLHPFIAPLAPFLDPGSLAFERPSLYEYELLARTLADHRKALDGLSWKYFLNYRTRLMGRDDIVYITYDAAKLLNEVKGKYGLIEEKEAEALSERLELAKSITMRIDAIMMNRDEKARNRQVRMLEYDVEKTYGPLLCTRSELLKWPLKTTIDARLRIVCGLMKSALCNRLSKRTA